MDGIVYGYIDEISNWLKREENLKPIREERKLAAVKKAAAKKKHEKGMAIIFIVILIVGMIGSLFYLLIPVIPKSLRYIERHNEVTYYSYTVDEGETLHSIANRSFEAHQSNFERANVTKRNYYRLVLDSNSDIENPDVIYPGQRIIYPVF